MDIAPANFAGVGFGSCGTPAETIVAKGDNEHVGSKTREPSVPVDERMDRHEAMVKSHSKLVAFVDGVRDLIPNIAKKAPDLLRDAPVIDTEILIRGSVRTRPTPDFSEHPVVQPANEALSENLIRIEGAPACPTFSSKDVVLLYAVQIVTRCEPRGDES